MTNPGVIILRPVLGAAALALALSACGGSPATPTPAAPAATSTGSTTTPASAPTSSGSASPSSATSAATAAAEVITIKDFMFAVPASVKAGSTVTITNSDNEAHTVTSKDAGFDVKVAGRGGTAQLTAPSKPGTYPLTCDFHATMKGSLVVS